MAWPPWKLSATKEQDLITQNNTKPITLHPLGLVKPRTDKANWIAGGMPLQITSATVFKDPSDDSRGHLLIKYMHTLIRSAWHVICKAKPSHKRKLHLSAYNEKWHVWQTLRESTPGWQMDRLNLNQQHGPGHFGEYFGEGGGTKKNSLWYKSGIFPLL